jgi:hypothetical protein
VGIIKALKTMIIWGWSPLLITALAIVAVLYEWEVWVVATLAGVSLVIGMSVALVSSGERHLESVSLKLRQLAANYNRRFTGTSNMSIYTIIDTLFALEDPQLWDWARACDMSARVFSAWCDSFVDRIESDNRTGRFRVYLRSYVNELWRLNNHYYEFIEQFYEIAEKIEVPASTIDQYNRFAMEYNSFVQSFRDSISELKAAAATEIEPPSVKLARKLPGGNPTRSFQDEESYF